MPDLLKQLLEQHLAPERCVEMVLKAMHEPGKAAREGYLAAAQFFALAAKTTHSGGVGS